MRPPVTTQAIRDDERILICAPGGRNAQLIDDTKGHTVAAVNWIEPELRKLTATEQATKAGELLAERGKAAGVETCVFDRGGYQYHGRVKALADGAREGGLAF